MLINCVLKTSEDRGDHSADIMVAVSVTDETTIGELINKCFEEGLKGRKGGRRVGNYLTDHIEIRIAT